MTTWNPTIPNPANVPANDATAMQQNFSVLDTAFQVDHVPLSTATNQGFHRQISFSGTGSTTFAPDGTTSYEYQKLLTGNVRSYLEYQPSGPDTLGGNPAFVPLSFKAYAVFDPTGVAAGNDVPLVQYKRKFNVFSIKRTNVGIWTITFINPMPDAFYSTFTSFLFASSSPSDNVSSQVANSVVILTSSDSFTLATVAVM